MANLSTLTVSLVAETAKFTNGLKKSRKDASAWSRAVRKSFAGAAIGATALTGSLSILVRRSLQVVDQQTKMAARLGLSQKALVGLTLAAEQTGNSQTNLQLALQRSTRRIAEAAKGTGTAVGALKDLGLEAKSLSALSPDEAFIKIAKAFESIDQQSERVRLAFKLFDSEGVGLVNTIKLGEDGIRAFIKRTEELGVALTGKQTKAIEDANDAINTMKTAFTGLGNQLAARFAPTIRAVAGFVERLVERITNAIPKFTAWTSSILGTKRALDSLTISDLNAEMVQLTSDIGEFVDMRDTAQAIIDEQTGQFAPPALVKQIEDVNAKIAVLTKRYQEAKVAKEALAATDSGVANVGGGDLTGEGGAGANNGFLDSLTRKWIANVQREFQENMKMFDEWQRRAEQATAATRTPLEALQIKLDQIRTDLRVNPFFSAELAQREASAAVDAYLAELNRLKEKTDDVTVQMSEFQRAAFENMQGIMADYLFDPFEDGLKGMLKQFADMLRKMVAQILAQKILTAFFNYIGIPTTGVSAATTTGNAIGIGRTDNRARTVGENGPELFAPGASGSIRPLGSVSIETTNTFGGGDGLTAATLVPILEENNRKVKAEILDAFDRGAFA